MSATWWYVCDLVYDQEQILATHNEQFLITDCNIKPQIW